MVLFGQFGKLHKWINEVKWAFQRARKGYCDEDLWEIDTWFCTVFANMMQEFGEKTWAYPPNFADDDHCRETGEGLAPNIISPSKDEEEFKNWQNLVATISSLLRDAERECHNEYPSEANLVCKDKAFELLSKHFYDLWW